MTTSRTTSANNPVAAWRLSAETFAVKSLTMPTAINHVAIVAKKPIPAPHATGRCRHLLLPTMPAVIAASTKMHSSPSRNTSTPMSRSATVGLVCGIIGSGLPCAATPCHTKIPTTSDAAIANMTLNAGRMALGFVPKARAGCDEMTASCIIIFPVELTAAMPPFNLLLQQSRDLLDVLRFHAVLFANKILEHRVPRHGWQNLFVRVQRLAFGCQHPRQRFL